MENVKLSSSISSNLLSLQYTASLVNKTQNRLSTGLKVSSAIDDAVSYFQAKSLSDRSDDLSARKDSIDQGISNLNTALSAVESIEDIFTQMKGILLSAKSSTDSERITLAKQFNTLAIQVSNLSNDASYQGLNLTNSTASTLKVQFSEKSNSYLTITGSNNLVSMFVGMSSYATSAIATNIAGIAQTWSSVLTNVSMFDAAISVIDSAVSSVRSNAKSLGSNVSLLKTRLDFAAGYINTLMEGANKLIMADLNEEGANLVALQTRQQLSVQALAFAGQSDQNILQLFR